jgi:DNA-damage-inducible protein J
MAQSNINFRMDTQLKKDLESTCKDMGMSMTTAFTVFAKKVVSEHKIPFEITADSLLSEKTKMENKDEIN